MNCCVLSDGVSTGELSCIVKPVVVWPGWMAWAGCSPGRTSGSPTGPCGGAGCAGGGVLRFWPGVNSTVLRFLR